MAEIIDATKDLTLSEVGDRDLDNYRLLLKECKAYVFDTQEHAWYWWQNCVDTAIRRLGVNQRKIIQHWQRKNRNLENPKDREFILSKLNELFKHHNIWPESREYPPGKEYLSGTYINYKNELAYLILWPIEKKRGKSRDTRIVIMNDHRKEYHVITNVKI